MNKKIIFFDIDGTLSDHQFGIPVSAARAVGQLKENNHFTCICTGRSKSMIQDDVLQLPFDAIIAGGGSYIEWGGQVLKDDHIPKPLLHQAIEMLKEHRIFYSLETKNNIYMTKEMASFLLASSQKLRGNGNSEMQRLMSEREKMKYQDNMGDFTEEEAVHKLCFVAHKDQLGKIEAVLKSSLQFIVHPSLVSDQWNGEAIVKGCNKGNAVKQLCKHVGISIDNTVAFGDSANDMDLLAVVNDGVAMGNAMAELKNKAKYVCEDVMEDGIYKQLIRLNLIHGEEDTDEKMVAKRSYIPNLSQEFL